MDKMKTIKIILQTTSFPDIEIWISDVGDNEIRIKQADDTVLLKNEHLKAFIDALQLFLECKSYACRTGTLRYTRHLTG